MKLFEKKDGAFLLQTFVQTPPSDFNNDSPEESLLISSQLDTQPLEMLFILMPETKRKRCETDEVKDESLFIVNENSKCALAK